MFNHLLFKSFSFHFSVSFHIKGIYFNITLFLSALWTSLLFGRVTEHFFLSFGLSFFNYLYFLPFFPHCFLGNFLTRFFFLPLQVTFHFLCFDSFVLYFLKLSFLPFSFLPSLLFFPLFLFISFPLAPHYCQHSTMWLGTQCLTF